MKTNSTTYALSPLWALLLRDLQCEPEALLQSAQLPVDLFTGGPRRVSAPEYHALWDAVARHARPLGVPLPVVVAHALSAELFDPPLFAALCSEHLSQAMERVARYKPLIGPLRMHIQTQQDEVSLTLQWPPTLEPTPVLGLVELFFWLALARLGTRAHVVPTRVTVPCEVDNPQAYETYLGVELTRSGAWSIHFKADDATRPFLTRQDAMWSVFEPELKARLTQLEHDATLSQKVRAVLLELLPAGEPGVEAVGRRLGLSRRTIQRRLKQESTTFRDILNATREALARHYLTRSELSSPEISFLLGYDDPNSFYRAFNTWTGHTPEHLRRALA